MLIRIFQRLFTMVNIFSHYIDVCFKIWNRIVYSFIARLKALWWGVNLGRHFIVLGKIFFKRYIDTIILIGNHCTCNSNLIGINCPCLFRVFQKGARIIIGDHCGFSGSLSPNFGSCKGNLYFRC